MECFVAFSLNWNDNALRLGVAATSLLSVLDISMLPFFVVGVRFKFFEPYFIRTKNVGRGMALVRSPSRSDFCAARVSRKPGITHSERVGIRPFTVM